MAKFITDDLTKRSLPDLDVDIGMRPKMPTLDGITDAHRRAGLHLAAIHRMHLQDMDRIAGFLEHLKQGKISATTFADRIKNAELTQNMRMFGTLCGRECQVLNFHHDAEEHMIFPQLEAQHITAMSTVVERLKQEHLIVHELLRRLQDMADALIDAPNPKSFDDIAAVFQQLHKVVKSHFGYEETELRDALGKYVPVF